MDHSYLVPIGNVSFALKSAFVLISLLSVFLLYQADQGKSKTFLLIVFAWMGIQLLIGLSDFYTDTSGTPPRFVLMVIPPALLILATFGSKAGRQYLDQLNLKKLTLLHTIRVPVEIVLYYLFLAASIPEIMTFAGSNMDILAGLTAPLVYFFAFNKKHSRTILIGWNIICILLLLNIVIIAILSTPTAFQQFGLEQPNIAITHFPFNWLPSVVVPIVFFSHFAALRILLSSKTPF
jgi:hypothetical protein